MFWFDRCSIGSDICFDSCSGLIGVLFSQVLCVDRCSICHDKVIRRFIDKCSIGSDKCFGLIDVLV